MGHYGILCEIWKHRASWDWRRCFNLSTQEGFSFKSESVKQKLILFSYKQVKF